MQNTTTAYKNSVESSSRLWRVKLEVGTTVIEEGIKTINYKGRSNVGSDYTLGSTAAAFFDATISKPPITLEGEKITLYFGLDLGSDIEWIKQGVFTAEKPTTNEGMTKITAYDNMRKMDKAYVSMLPNSTNTVAVLNEIATITGVKIATTGLSSISIHKPVGYTFREVLGYIAQLYAAFAVSDREGNIAIRMYSNPGETIDSDRYFENFDHNDIAYTTQRIVCNVGKDAEGKEVVYTVGSGERQMVLTNELMTHSYLQNIHTKLKDFKFMPGTLKFFGDNRLDLWDIVTVYGTDGKAYSVPLMEITHVFEGGLTTSIEAFGTSEVESNYNFNPPVSRVVEKHIENIVNASANGKNSVYHGPDEPAITTRNVEGDIWFRQNGDEIEIWILKKNEDGVLEWVEELSTRISDELQEEINKVTEAAEDARKAADEAWEAAEDAIKVGEEARAAGEDALEAAGDAKKEAEEAKKASEEAWEAAGDALKAGEEAKVAGEEALAVAEEVKREAEEAKQAGEDAKVAGKDALAAAEEAKKEAEEAKQVGEDAKAAGEEAKAVGEEAREVGEEAKALAEEAKSDSVKAINNAGSAVAKANEIANSLVDTNATVTQIGNQANTAQINAQNAMTEAQRALQEFSTLAIGGRNYLLDTANPRVAIGNGATNQGAGLYQFSFGQLYNIPTSIGEKWILNFEYELAGSEFSGSFTVQFNNAPWTRVGPRLQIADAGKYEAQYSVEVTEQWLEATAITRGIMLRLDNVPSTVSMTVTKMKWEKGNKTTDWTVAPEDLEQTITALTLDVEKNSERLAVTATKTEVNAIQGTLDTTKTLAEQTAGAITALATKTEVNTLTGKVTAVESGLAIEAGKLTALSTKADSQGVQLNNLQSDYAGLSSTVSKIATDLSATSMQFTNLSQTVSAISATAQAAQNGVTSLNTRIQTAESSISTVSSKIDNLAIGGRNYLLDTATSKAVTGNGATNQAGTLYPFSFGQLRNIPTTVGEKWTLSFEYELTGRNFSGQFTVQFNNVPWTRVGPIVQITKAGKFEAKHTVEAQGQWLETTATASRPMLRLDNVPSTVSITVTKMKWEKGDKATDWTVAQEELAAQSQISQLATDINLRVEKNSIINQINVSGESILIAGNKVHITGQTTIANAIIKTAHIVDANITNAKIADLAVSTAKIANLAVSSAKIANLAVGTAQIAALAVTEAKIGSLAVTNAKIGNAAITSAKIANLAVGTAQIGDGVITNAKIGSLAVTNAKIADLAVNTAKIANLAITSAKIANLAVGTAQIGDGVITNVKIGNAAVTEAKIGSLAVTNAKIGDLAVNTAKIANLAITSAKIANLAVGTAQIGDGVITNAKIGNLAVTSAKIGDLAVTAAKIGNAAIITAKIADAAITNAKIATLDAAKITTGTMLANRISGGTLILGGSGNGNGVLRINNASGSEIGRWDNTGLTATRGSFSGSLNAASGTFNGTITNVSGADTIAIRNGRIFISRNSVETGQLGAATWNNSTARGLLMHSEAQYVSMGVGSSAANTLTQYYIINNGLNPSGNNERHVFTGTARFRNDIYLGSHNVRIQDGFYTSGGRFLGVEGGGLRVNGSLEVLGAKHRVVNAFGGQVSMNAVESASAFFQDYGNGVVGEDGECFIFLDPTFKETIDTKHDYYIQLTQTSSKKTEYVKKEAEYFIVYGDVGARFDWVISAKQKGYEMDRMEDASVPKRQDFSDIPIINQGNTEKLANEYLEQYVKENE